MATYHDDRTHIDPDCSSYVARRPDEESECEHCGCPSYTGDRIYVRDGHFFCSHACVSSYLTDAAYQQSAYGHTCHDQDDDSDA